MGYHYFIGTDGTTKQTRNEREVGHHAAANQYNYKSVGIALAGNFLHELPNERQLASLMALVRELQFRYDIPKQNVKTHSQIAQTSCGGTALISYITSNL